MSVAFVSRKTFVNVDSSVSSAEIKIAASSGYGVVVHIAVSSAEVTVDSVVDDFGNTYSPFSVLANDQQPNINEYDAAGSGVKDDYILGECWAAASTGTVTKVTVTLTGGARFAVDVQAFSGVSALGNAFYTKQVGSSAPSISFNAAVGSTSLISAGFSTVKGLNQAAAAGTTLRGSIAGAAEGNQGIPGVALTTVTKSSAAGSPFTTTLALAPVSSQSYSISISDGSPNAGSSAVPATYAVCAVELKA